MAGRIEHDEYTLGLGLMFGHASTERLGPFGYLKELLAAVLHVAHGRQAVDADVEMHPHLLLAGDCWPDGGHEGLLSLELELVFAGRRPHQRPAARNGLGAINDLPPEQCCVELGKSPSIGTSDHGSGQSGAYSIHAKTSEFWMRSVEPDHTTADPERR